MGVCPSRKNRGNYAWENDPGMFIQKMKLQQQEINVILQQREEETEVYERELMVFAFREAEWKKERKKLREKVKRVCKSLEEREDRIRGMEDEAGMAGKNGKPEEVTNDGENNSTAASASFLLGEQMRQERSRRDEAVEKWKMLYLAIKHELDNLIQRTHEGTLYWRPSEDLMEDLQRELNAKDETIEALKVQIASMEDEEYKRKREVDILRQSLRIMSSSSCKGITSAQVKNPSKTSIRYTKSISKLAYVNENEHYEFQDGLSYI